MRACDSCAAENPDGARFCAVCGGRLPDVFDGRKVRKTVTVLFADVAGSTELGERFDVEAVRARMARFFEVARTIIEGHGGTVEKFIGDAVMAVFGVPVAHEDDALRAVTAAAKLQDAITRQGDFAIRIGVDTGEVVAGDPSERQTFVTGDAVNVAARLQAAGSAGDVLLGPATVALVRGAVSLGPPLPLTVKGKSRPVEAHRLLGVLGDAAGRHRSAEPLVGRAADLAALERTWRTVTDDRRPSLVTLIAPPGVGKSRLVAEFAAHRTTETEVLSGRCLSYGDGITYWPIREIVHAAAHVDESDGAFEAREKIEALLAGEPEADVLGRRVASAIGLSPEAAPQEEVFWAIRRLFEAVARRRELLIVIEDLHWAQPTLLDLIEYAVDLATNVPLLILATARPELLDQRPGWASGRPNAALVRLEPLGPDDAADMLAGLPGGTAVPEGLRRRILATAEGTPLYVEAFVGLLRDEGHLQRADDGRWVATGEMTALAVPPTVQALLAVRLDALPAPERILAERASVVGRSFESAMLGELDPELTHDLGRRLLGLVRRELLRPDRAILTTGDAFSFRHILIRDAAYEALPKAERAVLHERFADWLEQTVGERLTEYEEIVGYHLERAHRCRAELGETGDHLATLAARAGTHLAAAGQRAFDRGDMTAAEALLSAATTAFPVGSTARLGLLPDLGFALFLLGRLADSETLLADATDEATAAGEMVLAIRARLEAALVRTMSTGDYRPSLGVVETAIPVLEREGDHLGLARAHLVQAMAAWVVGTIGAAVASRHQAISEAAMVGDRRTESHFAFWGAEFYGPAPAIATIERLEAQLSGATMDPMGRAQILFPLAGLYAMRGRVEEARTTYQSLPGIFSELGARIWAPASSEIGGWAEIIVSEYDRAERWMAQGIVDLERSGVTGYLSTLLGQQSIAVAYRGDAAAALEIADRALRIGSPEDAMMNMHAQTGRAIALRGLGDLPAAVDAGRRAVRIAETTDCITDHASALMAVAGALEASGEGGEATWMAQRALALCVAKENLMGERQAARFLEQRIVR